MPKSDSQEPSNDEMRELLVTMFPDIRVAVGNACRNLHLPHEDDVNRFTNRIVEKLMEKDYHLLRRFKIGSPSQPWLYQIARRNILHWLKEEKRKVSFEDAPPDSFVSPPDQEQALLRKENAARLQAALARLTKRQRLLFRLICQGLSAEKIAKKTGIKKESVGPMRDVLIKRLQKLLEEGDKKAKPDGGHEER